VMMRFIGGVLLLMLACAMVFGALRPICTPLTPEAVRLLRPHFDDRDDHDLIYLKIYQRRNGVPSECKTWVARQLMW
jgi:hypothetical protein